MKAGGGIKRTRPDRVLVRLEEKHVRGIRETGELQMSSVAQLRQRDPELYVITQPQGYIEVYDYVDRIGAMVAPFVARP